MLRNSLHRKLFLLLFVCPGMDDEQSERLMLPLRDTSGNLLQEAASFLVGLFDPTLDLLPEFRGASIYWLYHDNYLAAKVLEKTNPDVARRVVKAIHGFGVKESGKIETSLARPSGHYLSGNTSLSKYGGSGAKPSRRRS